MPRKQKASALTCPDPIPLPHDGPLYHNETSTTLIESFTQEIEIQLVQQLQQAGTIREQLQLLQNHRNLILRGKSLSPDECLTSPTLYRLFLEWSLSYLTTVPLQRALQSTLKAISTQSHSSFSSETIQSTTLSSMFSVSNTRWKSPLQSLEVALRLPLLKLLQTSTMLYEQCLEYMKSRVLQLKKNDQEPSPTWIQASLHVIQLLQRILPPFNANTENTATAPTNRIPHSATFQEWCQSLLECTALPSDAYQTIAIVYGRLWNASFNHTTALSLLQETISNPSLSPLAQLSVLHGIAATFEQDKLQTDVVSEQDGALLWEVCWKHSLHAAQNSTDPLVRWTAMKGLSTLATRWKQSNTEEWKTSPQTCSQMLLQETLQMVLQAWENPPMRKLGTTIPTLFESLVQLLPLEDIPALGRRIWDQPVHRRGRYLALDILLPHLAGNGDPSYFRPEAFLEGIGDSGPNTGPMADLWIKLLAHLWEQEVSTQLKSNQHTMLDDDRTALYQTCFEEWKRHWVPSLSMALLIPEINRKKQIAAFCIRRLIDFMRRTKELKTFMDSSICSLLDILGSTRRSQSINDVIILWAQLEVRSRGFDILSLLSWLLISHGSTVRSTGDSSCYPA